ncbi:DUF6756 family protein [Snodgrassella sp. ESL0253]|uniref:DUF6756 family protein n=1 Tax=Snodgrassella sp. ESL0253 TaxID=2705031 RepID=UPI0015828E0E|nr:DUF6756 family protein [Snodgrassella sp. ESL0253]NUE67745.1 hypothetical protein [Snodgrassella sp. ESL0253]
MRYIADDFIVEAKKLRISYKEINMQDALRIRNNVENLYCKKGYGALWERISIENFGFHTPNNKAIFKNLNAEINNEVIIFFEESTDKTFFKLKNIVDLMNVVNELFGFVFYITDENESFLLCRNDHEFIIGAGKAKKWVENLLKNST